MVATLAKTIYEIWLKANKHDMDVNVLTAARNAYSECLDNGLDFTDVLMELKRLKEG